MESANKKSLRIFVASLTEDCVAHLALDAEFVEHEVFLCEGDYAYGSLLQVLWASGQGFIMVEHDIVPWPGAIYRLQRCRQDWCAYEYPLNFGFVSALGCTKFSATLTQRHKNICHDWDMTHWGAIDAVVGRRIPGRPHIHHPPVAHVRKY